MDSLSSHPTDAAPVALGYIRRSAIQRGERTDSPEKQLAAIQSICDAHGWTLELYQDAEEGRHFSGRSEAGRPAWQRLKRQLRRPEVRAVVVASLDRLSRSPKDFFIFLDDLRRHEIDLISAKESFDTTTAIGRAFLAILMVIASLESDMASERVTATIEHRQRQGYYWGNVPYGYLRRNGRDLVPDPEAAPVVARIYDAYATGVRAYQSIADELNAAGHRMKHLGRTYRFTANSVRFILLFHWIYRGYLVDGGSQTAHAEHDEDHPPANVTQGRHPPLISLEQARAALRVRAARRNDHPKTADCRVHLLSGLLYCGHCGEPLMGRTSNNGWKEYTYYVHRRRCSMAGYVPAEPLDRQVLDYVARLTLPDAAELAADLVAIGEPADPAPIADPDGARRARCERRLANLRDLFADAELDRDEYVRRRAEVLAELVALDAGAAPRPTLADLRALVVHVGERIRSDDDPAEQRQALRILFERLECGFVDGAFRITRYVVRPDLRPLFGQ